MFCSLYYSLDIKEIDGNIDVIQYLSFKSMFIKGCLFKPPNQNYLFAFE